MPIVGIVVRRVCLTSRTPQTVGRVLEPNTVKLHVLGIVDRTLDGTLIIGNSVSEGAEPFGGDFGGAKRPHVAPCVDLHGLRESGCKHPSSPGLDRMTKVVKGSL